MLFYTDMYFCLSCSCRIDMSFVSSGESAQPRADLGEGALSGWPHHLARWKEGCSACRGKVPLHSKPCRTFNTTLRPTQNLCGPKCGAFTPGNIVVLEYYYANDNCGSSSMQGNILGQCNLTVSQPTAIVCSVVHTAAAYFHAIPHCATI